MKDKSKKFWSLIPPFKDELIFIFMIIGASLLIVSTTYTGVSGLILSLIMIVGVTAYYSITFFKNDAPQVKLYFYVAVLPFLMGYFALIYKAFGLVTPDSNGISEQLDWFNAFYFSVVTWTTLGYGDFRPDTTITKSFVMIEVMLGYIYMGVFVGKLLILGLSKK